MPDRRPAQRPSIDETASEETASEESSPEDALYDLNLTAIAIDSEQRLAVIQDLHNNQTYKVRVGQRVSGWVVSAIYPDRVVLLHKQTREELRLHEFWPEDADDQQ